MVEASAGEAVEAAGDPRVGREEKAPREAGRGLKLQLKGVCQPGGPLGKRFSLPRLGGLCALVVTCPTDNFGFYPRGQRPSIKKAPPERGEVLRFNMLRPAGRSFGEAPVTSSTHRESDAG